MADTNEINPDGLPEHEPHERSDGCESQVACARVIATSGFQMVQKRQDGVRAKRAKRQLINGSAMAARETVPVCIREMTDAQVLEAQLVELSLVVKRFLAVHRSPHVVYM